MNIALQGNLISIKNLVWDQVWYPVSFSMQEPNDFGKWSTVRKFVRKFVWNEVQNYAIPTKYIIIEKLEEYDFNR